jgi:nucleoid-associated protein YgaU
MTLNWLGMAVTSLTLVVVGSAGVFIAVVHAPQRSPVVATISTPSPPTPPQARQDAASATAVKADIGTLGAPLAAAPRHLDADVVTPTFDVVHIAATGEAVIAGNAAPGASVELLCGGQSCDRTVADQAGQFVMGPSRLPPGTYELALRSRRPDGQEATSRRNVTASLAPRVTDQMFSSPRPLRAATGAAVEPTSRATVRPDALRAEQSADRPTSAIAPPRIATRLVARRDSLWRISRMTYGDGLKYPAIFNANRSKIRNPDLIYPGQRLVLPDKLR